VSRLLAVERVRTRIAMDLHDELGSSLSRVAVLSEVVKGDIDHARPDAAYRLEEIANTARELLASTNDLVWSIHPDRDDLQSLVARVRAFGAELLEGRGVQWEVAAPSNLAGVALSAEVRWHLLMILKEGIHNIARHAEARHAVLAVTRHDGMLNVELRDDGRGYEARSERKDASGGRQGLRSMAERADVLGGSLVVESRRGAGTRLTLRLPL